MARELTITVEIPPDSQAILKKLTEMPDKVPIAIKRGMDRALGIVRGSIQRDSLSGKGPFPKEQHRLGERTGALRGSLLNEPAVIQGNTVTGSIGLHHKYGHIHEFGMLIFGKPLLRFQIEGKWIIARKVLIPARAPVRFGVESKTDYIASEIGIEIEKEFEKAAT